MVRPSRLGYRGGLGTEVEVEALASINYMTRSDRVVNPPWGLEGGREAKGNRIAVRRNNGELTVYPGGKLDTRRWPKATPTS